MRTSKNDRDVARQEGRAGVYGKVTDRIIGYIERNRSLPWRKPWVTPYGDMAPRNFQSGKPYRGVNAILTSMNGYSSPFWLTFNQAKALGGSVRKGERSTPIVYWNTVRKPEAGVDGERPDEDETDEPERKAYYGFYRMYSVFNAEQIDGVDFPAFQPPAPEHPFAPIEAAEKLVKDMQERPVIAYGGGSAYYLPLADKVVVPEPSAFPAPEGFYSTLFHELAHSTGHPKRLNRFDENGSGQHFGSRDYSKEELVAEIASCFVLNSIGINTEKTDMNSAAYVKSWLHALQDNPKMIVQAAGLAGKASDYIMGADEDERNGRI